MPSCPGWKVADVVRHVGGVHQWAAIAVRSGGPDRPEFPHISDDLQGAALLDWAEVRAAELLASLAEADPDAGAWTFGPPRTVRFWLRRQAHETSVHAWDAGNAVGKPLSIASDVAADGLAEFLDVMLGRMVKRVPAPWTGQTVHFHRTDGDGEWLATLGPDGAVTVEHKHDKGQLAVRASAPDLLLWATNRIGSDRVELFGDSALADRWRSELAF